MPRRELRKAAQELRSELDHLDDADHRLWLNEVTNELEALADGREALDGLRARIEDRAQHFIVDHPRIEPVLRRAVESLSALGL